MPGMLLGEAGADAALWGELEADPISHAMDRIAEHVHRTPMLTSRTLDERCGCKVFLKCENFQRIGAFKFRGAMNAVLKLSSEARARGVITHSSGNHAQALALAGQLAGVPVCVVMPSSAPEIKRKATLGYGAKVVSCEPTQEAREGTTAALISEYGYHLVHPYDNWDVISGQGTTAWELWDQAGPEPLDYLIAPTGGGGLLAGTVLAVRTRALRAWPVSGCDRALHADACFSPLTRVLGAEPARADDAARSLRAGAILPSDNPRTIADGLKTSLGQRPFAVIQRWVADILFATEEEIVDTMQFVWERLKIIVEPSSVVPLAPLFFRRFPYPVNEDTRIGVILSGGNLDLQNLFDDYRKRI